MWTERISEEFMINGGYMFLALFVLFLIAWVFGFVVFHVASGLIHLLLLVGAVFLVIHLMRPRKAAL